MKAEIIKTDIFHMVERETGKNTYLRILELREWCLANPPKTWAIPVDQATAERALEDNAIDPERLIEIMREGPPMDPIILIRLGVSEPPEVMIADGIHRHFLAAALGLPSIEGWLIEEADWRKFEIAGPRVSYEEFRERPTATLHRRNKR